MQCSVLESAHLLGKKWSVPILLEMRAGKFEGFYGFSMRSKVTPRTLSKQLKELEKDGLIKKTDSGKYDLGEKGEELCKIIDELKKWNVKWNNIHPTCLDKTCVGCRYFEGSL